MALFSTSFRFSVSEVRQLVRTLAVWQWGMLAGVLLVLFSVSGYAAEVSARAEQRVSVQVLNVGQGDAIYVALPNGTRWLIDGGPDDSVVRELDAVLPFFDRRLTGIILTHPHADHVTGLVSVLGRYDIETVVFPPAVHTSPVYRTFLELVAAGEYQVIAATQPFVWEGESDGVTWQWEFFYPNQGEESVSQSDLNDVSLVSKLQMADTSFLFMGDAPAAVERLLVAQGWNLRSTVLKVGHHGSDTSTDPMFLQAVQPELAVISVGSNNRFGHPDQEVIRRLTEKGVQLYRTDSDGRVSFTYEKEGLKITTSQ